MDPNIEIVYDNDWNYMGYKRNGVFFKNEEEEKRYNDLQATLKATQDQSAKAAEEAKKAEEERQLKAFNESILQAQKSLSSNYENTKSQMEAMDERQRQIDQSKQMPVKSQQGISLGFNVEDAMKAGVSKTGAASSAAPKKPMPQQQIQQQNQVAPSNVLGTSSNTFKAPDIKGIQLGGE